MKSEVWMIPPVDDLSGPIDALSGIKVELSQWKSEKAMDPKMLGDAWTRCFQDMIA